jgi:glutamate dehydrogenase (NADP+)
MSKLIDLERFMEHIKVKNPHETEFHQAVDEFAESVIPFVNEHEKYREYAILERITEPDRVIMFRVTWEDDKGLVHVNRGFRVQFNNAIGPYKGGLRFHPSVNLSILKFLGFEQIFKNSLTTLAMGAGKGGSDFDPKGKSDREVMRFCQAFITELYRHIGKNMDVPAGDIGVGGREISYMFGQYKRLKNEFEGVLTGKNLEYGGSKIRKEATGYGTVFFMDEMLKAKGDSVKNKTAVISGSGNVAQYAAEKLIQLGAKVVSLSDSNGFIYDKDGIDQSKLEYIIDLKTNRRGRISDYAEKYKCEYHENKKPWTIPCDLAFPCATQNEIDEDDARELVKNGCIAVAEGANMPSTKSAVDIFLKHKVMFGPAKAANAGGVAVSGLEMSQNSQRLSWSHEELEERLHNIMKSIHTKCLEYGKDESGDINYVKGANLAGFVKVADAMLAYGVM